MRVFLRLFLLINVCLFPAGPSVGQDPEKPATLAMILQSVDLEKLPRPARALNVHGGPALLSCQMPPFTFAEAAEFYRKSLTPLGWAEDKEPIPGLDNSQLLYLAFDKGGMRLVITGQKADRADPMTVTLVNTGNVDARKMPRMADAKPKIQLQTAVIYTTAAKPDEVAAFYSKEFSARGWRATLAPAARFLAKEGRTVLRFVQNAMECNVVIAAGKDRATEVTLAPQVRQTFEPADVRAHCTPKEVAAPAKQKEYLEVLDVRKLPRPEMAEKLEHDKEFVVHSVGTAYQAALNLDDVAVYYRKVFDELGWARLLSQGDSQTHLDLKFEKNGNLVSVTASKPAESDKVRVSVTNHGNVDLRQLPYPPGAEIGCVRDAHVHINTALSKAEAEEFYRKELPKLGWEAQATRGQGTLRFTQNEVYLHIEVGTDAEERTSMHIHTLLRGVE